MVPGQGSEGGTYATPNPELAWATPTRIWWWRRPSRSLLPFPGKGRGERRRAGVAAREVKVMNGAIHGFLFPVATSPHPPPLWGGGVVVASAWRGLATPRRRHPAAKEDKERQRGLGHPFPWEGKGVAALSLHLPSLPPFGGEGGRRR